MTSFSALLRSRPTPLYKTFSTFKCFYFREFFSSSGFIRSKKMVISCRPNNLVLLSSVVYNVKGAFVSKGFFFLFQLLNYQEIICLWGDLTATNLLLRIWENTRNCRRSVNFICSTDENFMVLCILIFWWIVILKLKIKQNIAKIILSKNAGGTSKVV